MGILYILAGLALLAGLAWLISRGEDGRAFLHVMAEFVFGFIALASIMLAVLGGLALIVYGVRLLVGG